MELDGTGSSIKGTRKSSKNHGKVINIHQLSTPHFLLACGFWETASKVESRIFPDGLRPLAWSHQLTEVRLRGRFWRRLKRETWDEKSFSWSCQLDGFGGADAG